MIKKLIDKIRYRNLPFIECPLCGYKAKILKTGSKIGKCPKCTTYGRHRLTSLWLKEIMTADDTRSILHVAPEPGLKNFIKKEFPNTDYADLDSGEGESGDVASYKYDLCDLPHPDNCFDLAICSHVLEHIIDDRKAIKELFRVMKPEGTALILLPIFNDLEKTFEDPRITNRKTRKKVFGQEDHVRKCGLDYWDRITEAGFQLGQKNYTFEGSREEKRCYSLLDGMREKDYQDYLNLFTKPKLEPANNSV